MVRETVVLLFLSSCVVPSRAPAPDPLVVEDAVPVGDGEENASFDPPAEDADDAAEVFADETLPVVEGTQALSAATSPGRTCSNVDFPLDVPVDAVARAAFGEVSTCEWNNGSSDGSCSSSNKHIQCGYGDAEKYLGEGTPCGHRQWCTAFVSWAYRAAHEGFDSGPWSCGGDWLHVCGSYSCNGGDPDNTLQGWFKREKTWTSRGTVNARGIVPAPGDFIRYQWASGNGHSGVVLSVAGDTMYTVEGNVNDSALLCDGGSHQGVAVCRIDRWREYDRIYGFGQRRGSGRSLTDRYDVSRSSHRVELETSASNPTARRVQLVLPCSGAPARVKVSHEWVLGIFDEDANVPIIKPSQCAGAFVKSVWLGVKDDTGPYGRRTRAKKLRVDFSSGSVNEVRVLD